MKFAPKRSAPKWAVPKWSRHKVDKISSNLLTGWRQIKKLYNFTFGHFAQFFKYVYGLL